MREMCEHPHRNRRIEPVQPNLTVGSNGLFNSNLNNMCMNNKITREKLNIITTRGLGPHGQHLYRQQCLAADRYWIGFN